jgi:hypothetical protein
MQSKVNVGRGEINAQIGRSAMGGYLADDSEARVVSAA